MLAGLGAAGIVTGCMDLLLTDPARLGPAALSLSITYSAETEPAPGWSAAYDAADQVWVRLSRGTVPLLEQTAAFEPVDGEARLTFEIELEADEETIGVSFELRQGEDRLFRGDTLIVARAGQQRDAPARLEPYVAEVLLDSPADPVSVGDTLDIGGVALFASQDTVTTELSWAVLDEGIVELLEGSRIAAIGPGTARLVGSAAGKADTATVVVELNAPVLMDLALSGTHVETADGPASIFVSVTARIEGSHGLATFDAAFTSPGGQSSSSCSGAWDPGQSQATTNCAASFPQLSEPGLWTLGLRIFSDGGAETVVSAAELEERGLPNRIRVLAESDVDPPALVDVRIDPTSLDVAGGSATVSVEVDATDNLAGLQWLNLNFRSPSGVQTTGCAAMFDGVPLEGTARCTTTVNRYAEQGDWSLAIWLSDAVGNERHYRTEDLEERGLPRAFTVTSEGDTVPPQLMDLRLSPASLDLAEAPDTIRVEVDATDNLSGVQSFHVNFNSPSGIQWVGCGRHLEGHPLEATASCGAHFNRYAESGDWTVSAWLYDVTGNWRHYSHSALADLGLPSVITVVSEGDTEPPTLVGLSIQPGVVDVADSAASFNIEIEAADDLSGLRWYSINLNSPSGGQWAWCGGSFPDAPLEATVSCEGTIPRFAETGDWVLHVWITDVVGNDLYLEPAMLEERGLPNTLTVVMGTDP